MADIEKNQVIDLIIEDMLDDGRAFGRFEGCAVFVKGGVPGDRIRAEVTKSGKSSVEAVLSEIIEPSPDRVAAECPYSDRCGGCTLQELSYDAQKRLKAAQVRAKLTRIGGIEDPKVNDIIGADTLRHYRNKATFAVGSHGEVGFVRGKTHFVTDIDDCMLQTDEAMACAEVLRKFLSSTGVRCIRQLIVKTAFGTGEVMVVIESAKKVIPQIEILVEMLDDAVYGADVDVYSDVDSDEGKYSLESVSVIHNGKCSIIAGKPTITEKVTKCDGAILNFEISPQSFYQVNPEQMVRLYDKSAEYAALTGGETVLDLYCGIGTIGIWLAGSAARVIGIESVKPAIIDANRNSVINGLVNTRYIHGKAEEELPGMMGLTKLFKWDEVNERVEREPEIRIDKVDVAVLDPPRAGCDEALLEAVVKAEPNRIVYVSCDPGTLARDVKHLVSNGYEFVEATPVDQFPWTSHVEVIVLLSKLDSKKYISVELPLDDMDLTSVESKATYKQIQNYVLEKFGFKVSTLYIAQVKKKSGLEVRKHYNISNNENQKALQCPIEKEEAIMDALKHFMML